MPEVVNWGDISGGLGDLFLQWEKDIDVRILSPTPLRFKHHFLDRSYYCTNPCPYCQQGHAATTKFGALVYVRQEKVVRVLESGPQLFGAIRAVVEKYGHPWENKYDITLHKEGSGLKTRYQAWPVPQSAALTQEDIAIIQDGVFDLDDFYNQRIAYQLQYQEQNGVANAQAQPMQNPGGWQPTIVGQGTANPNPMPSGTPVQPAPAPAMPAQPNPMAAPPQAPYPAAIPGQPQPAPMQPPVPPGPVQNPNGVKKLSNEEFNKHFFPQGQ